MMIGALCAIGAFDGPRDLLAHNRAHAAADELQFEGADVDSAARSEARRPDTIASGSGGGFPHPGEPFLIWLRIAELERIGRDHRLGRILPTARRQTAASAG